MILSPIEKRIREKIQAVGVPLKNWDVRINYGVKTGLNEAFIIDEYTKNKLLEQDPKSAEIIRPILRGRDIKKYQYDFANYWLIHTHNGLKEKSLTPIDIDLYPSVKEHLDQFKVSLEKRLDKGYTPYNLRNCAYMEDFSRQKIVWGEISDSTKFAIDHTGEYLTEATTFFMTGNSLFYILACLNSTLSQYIFSKIGTTTGVGTVRWKKFTIEQLEIPQVSSYRELEYESIVKAILDSELSATASSLEGKINSMIYEDFGLTKEEIAFIDAQ